MVREYYCAVLRTVGISRMLPTSNVTTEGFSTVRTSIPLLRVTPHMRNDANGIMYPQKFRYSYPNYHTSVLEAGG